MGRLGNKKAKGFTFTPYMKGVNIYIDVIKNDKRSLKTTLKVVGETLVLVDTTMPDRMHREYAKTLETNINDIVNQLKWYQRLLYKVTGVFRKKG